MKYRFNNEKNDKFISTVGISINRTKIPYLEIIETTTS